MIQQPIDQVATPAPEPKPGYLTTEFWSAIAVKLLSFLALAGVISAGDAQSLGGAAQNAIIGVAAIVGAAYVFYTYLKNRLEIKKAHLEAQKPARE